MSHVHVHVHVARPAGLPKPQPALCAALSEGAPACIKLPHEAVADQVRSDRPSVRVCPPPAASQGIDRHLDLHWHHLRWRASQGLLGGGHGRRFGIDHHDRREFAWTRPGRGRGRLPRVPLRESAYQLRRVLAV
eukprot:scaffold145170_cov127-Phaeocystis_antarctica.AAC.3